MYIEIRRNSNRIIEFLMKDKVFIISLVLALITIAFRGSKIEYIDFKVIITLFNLMIVIKAFEELKLMDKLALSIIVRFKNTQVLSIVLIFITFFSSMILTNDVALLTMVPLTIIISKEVELNLPLVIVFETLGANLGSSFTPMGNPQNLFIYYKYGLSVGDFFATMTPIFLVGMFWLFFLTFLINKNPLNINIRKVEIVSKNRAIIFVSLFIFIILSVLRIISCQVALLVTLVVIVLTNKRLFIKVDYTLLLTFICFFIFIGNISNIPAVHSRMSKVLSDGNKTYLVAIILSQAISNVPCALLLSEFTTHWRELLLGVNIGGTGTLIASLASLISYKIFIEDRSEREANNYIKKFFLYNLLTLFIFTVIFYVI